MEIVSLQYTNIGPFRDQSVEIFPQAGNYSIQAPIGSGKSFLFFDWPLFALYRNSHRLMLNNLSETGEVVIEFREAWQQYRVQRRLKKTKTGETVQSQLRSQAPKARNSTPPILQIGAIKDFHLDPWYQKIDLKNEKDIQALLDSILPSKEVFQATYFLMQDSQNIFEATPKERLEIFKHVFGLLGIDELKETIAEKRRELNSLIKVRGDDSLFEEKFQSWHRRLLSLWEKIAHYHDLLLGEDREERKQFIAEQQLLADKLRIEQFRLPRSANYEKIFKNLQTQTEQYYAQQTTLQVHKTNYQHSQEALHNSQQALKQLKTRISTLEWTLQKQNHSALETKEKEIQATQEELDKLWTEQDKQKTKQLITSQTKGEHLWMEDYFDTHSNEWSLAEVSKFIDQLIMAGKEKNTALEYIDQKAKDYLSRLQSLEKRLQDWNPALEEYLKFSRKKVEEVNKILDTFDRRQEVINKLDDLIEKSTILAGSYDKQLVRELQTLQVEYTEFLKNSQQEKLQFERKALWRLLQELNWKTLQTRAEKETDLQRALTRQTQELSSLRQAQEAQIKQKTQLEELRQQLKEQERESMHLEKTLKETEQKYNKVQTQLWKTTGLDELKHQQSAFEGFQVAEQSLKELLANYKDNALIIQQTKEKEKKLANLYTIFSKELLLLVVQNNLPKIEDLMNAYLSQVVDYELRMSVDKRSLTSENLELQVIAVDEYGEREVKSLSGGQKVILKLVWMIAVSFVVDAPLLFLDETINNLDEETVSKVATILTSFVESKWKDFQFYVVSHDEQIQNLGIWDSRLFLSENTK